jgi:hypothetical protein
MNSRRHIRDLPRLTRRKSGFGTVRTRGTDETGVIADDSKGLNRVWHAGSPNGLYPLDEPQAVRKLPAFRASHRVPNSGFWEEARAVIAT